MTALRGMAVGLASRGGETCMGLHGGLAWWQWGRGGLAELCSMVV